MSKRKKYSEEFKQDAVRLVTEQGYSIAESARNLAAAPVSSVFGSRVICELGMSANTWRWRQRSNRLVLDVPKTDSHCPAADKFTVRTLNLFDRF